MTDFNQPVGEFIDPFAGGTFDPFRDPRCRCADAAQTLSAFLSGRDLELCELHQADAMKERKRDEARQREADYQALREHSRRELDRMVDQGARAPEPTCSCDVLTDAMTAFAGGEVAGCEVHRAASTSSQSPPLGSDALMQSLARATGATIDHYTEGN
jgi:hypothetical protein